MGSDEVIKDKFRYCLWIDDDQVEEALSFSPIKCRIQAVKEFRLKSPKKATQEKASIPWRFDEVKNPTHFTYALLMPAISSENRPYLPVRLVNNEVVPSNKNYVIFDPPMWVFSLLVSRLHFLWTATVCGRLGTGLSYSNTLGYNTFPVPHLTKPKQQALYHSAWKIQKIRASYWPSTLADLYDPKKMPLDLKQAHVENDVLLEGFYRKTLFEDDTDRLSFLFKMYTKRKEEEAKGSAKK